MPGGHNKKEGLQVNPEHPPHMLPPAGLSPPFQSVPFTTNEPQSYVFGGRNHPLHSNSQKEYLEEYATRNGFTNFVHRTDDGWSGTRWDRPGFLQIMGDIERGNVGQILIKDDCVILELNSESPENTGLCDVSSVF